MLISWQQFGSGKKSRADAEIVDSGCGRERNQVKELKTKELKQEQMDNLPKRIDMLSWRKTGSDYRPYW